MFLLGVYEGQLWLAVLIAVISIIFSLDISVLNVPFYYLILV